MLLLGNAFAFIGCALMIAVGLIKKKKNMLIAQTAQFAFQSLSNLVLGSVNGFFSCVLSVIRIFVFTRVKVTVWLKLAFLAVQFAFSLWMGADSFYEWVPFMSVLAYTWYLDTENPIVFKLVNLLGVILWAFHDIHYLNYVAFAFDILTMVSTLTGIALLLKERKAKVPERE